MLILIRNWAEVYMTSHPNISVYVDGGGSATGVQALIDGSTEICAASRPLRPSEVRELAERHGKLGISFKVAKDALSIYLHPQNPVQNLTMEQLHQIFNGKIRNWNEVGGADEPIHLVVRTPNSGTYLYFREHVLLGDAYAADAVSRGTTNAVIEEVLEYPNAIGYGGTAYGDQVIHCRVNGIAPTIENVKMDKYPISRYLYLYTIDTPQDAIRDFINWTTGLAGQAIVARTGYIPLWNQR
jgi:phosphate transport system substrate-binding protein